MCGVDSEMDICVLFSKLVCLHNTLNLHLQVRRAAQNHRSLNATKTIVSQVIWHRAVEFYLVETTQTVVQGINKCQISDSQPCIN